MFNSQQMWSVEFNQTKKGKIYNIISSTPEVVQKKEKKPGKQYFLLKKDRRLRHTKFSPLINSERLKVK